ncbi:MAG: helix-turn-helix domain-containing protein [Clostridia bacterium]|nr:helix-turn-helix domain-containing protein [Clostridia bacterium]
MQKTKISEIKPYVRYARYITTNDYKQFTYTIKAYDCRLFYCLGGVGNFEINGNVYPLKAGSLLIFKYGEPYAYYPNELDPMKLLGINFDYTYSSSDLSTPIPPVKKENFDINKILSPLTLCEELLEKPLFIDNAFSIEQELKTLNSEFTRREIFYETRCSALLCSIITQALRLAVKLPQKKHDSDVAQKIMNILSEKYGEQITLSDLGEELGYHPNYLNQIFMTRTGKPIYAYLQELRIMKAIDMLQNSTLPISEIAVSIGFCDIAHFSKTFKQKTGLSPSAFRIKG